VKALVSYPLGKKKRAFGIAEAHAIAKPASQFHRRRSSLSYFFYRSYLLCFKILPGPCCLRWAGQLLLFHPPGCEAVVAFVNMCRALCVILLFFFNNRCKKR